MRETDQIIPEGKNGGIVRLQKAGVNRNYCAHKSDELYDIVDGGIQPRRKAAPVALLVSHVNQSVFEMIRNPNLEFGLPQDEVALQFRKLACKHAQRA